MIDPVYLIVLEDGTEIFEDGHGKQEANRVAVTEYQSGYWMPPENNRGAIKAQGADGKVYIPETDVDYIVDLTDDEFRPVDR